MWSDPTLSQWARACGGELQGEDQVIGTVSTDSRTVETGDVYVALKGDYFDGHNYAATALHKGASALVVEQPQADCPISQVIVPDGRQSLGHLAGLLRQAFQGQVVALTGSAGKTSTRAMLQHIFGQQPGLLATEGNFNNDIGVPKTWFRLTDRHQRVLLELGANAVGEIAWTAGFSRPHISLLLNASEAHAGGFGGLEKVREAKGEILEATDREGGCVLNRDDPAYQAWLKRAGDRRIISFGQHSRADVCLIEFQPTNAGSAFSLSLPDGDISVEWPMLGRHMALNAAAAAATAWLAGVSPLDIAEGLSRMKPQPGRLEPMAGQHGGLLIHDAYNAAPAAVKAAIDVLAEQGDDTLLILADMGELGDLAESLHREVGQYARGRIGDLWTVGTLSRHTADAFGGRHFDTLETVLAALPSRLTETTAVLVKGSRSAGMERVVETLKRKP
ncbi:UDP-N-acetylmuramoyl-tripeptide--D-alanyl-D-alanine ligase [Saccharospirillum salsuginis]|uniref:UDP-N-acetylmuramoyl-tripeptide--D-alanyl-D-alanine ligase n=1 Tax=Saccharospirillum salsuginis TaxID=418750 RepID=A0A918K4Z6_9GAMM|nr:UDP-N-acetylmuramoyl-tripeptide--D-alanyl-D-alanine ligase [Saccharospirillum salsuginis]GGX46667.1 UDP-N-acetylmuramoyl-tripeptide--D-alanyl-D-alanine ligase [Saccharospirillum salsuginis]